MKKIIDFLNNPIFNVFLGLFGLIFVFILIFSFSSNEFHFWSFFAGLSIYIFSSIIGYGLTFIIKKIKKSGENPDNNI